MKCLKRNGRTTILLVIIGAQFCCTSLWFAGNGVMDDLVDSFHLSQNALSNLTSAVQFGFIGGTLVFALFNIADRYSPSVVFLVSALLGGLCNWGTVLSFNTFFTLFGFRFSTGFFLAGIYPVGMKIAADHFDKELGRSLGLLVGALVLGTALPHLLKELATDLPWEVVIQLTSSLAVLGGILMILFVPDGPYRKPSQQLNLSASLVVFRTPDFRAASFGYFGHMWELYTFWAFVPVILGNYGAGSPETGLNLSTWSFLIIGIGGPACAVAGYVAAKTGTEKAANTALLASCICCLLSPLLFFSGSFLFFGVFMLFWGMSVVADSPLFSTLVAQSAPAELKGTALTIVTCIGFLITIVSLQLLTYLQGMIAPEYLYMVLALGPVLGLLYRKTKSPKRKFSNRI